ncbi:hypothetical protein APY04_1922 [Hyphomicrobium sulfonivorans]|uniref:Uncharacterized protein n=1 Tax=Hyphomicrobium sulfonivorans TaxID=121290 RepID=A0A109BEW9_HYPSL|nr:hypothetical protein APY04_1922 [Hyphomicrobium sulfonivorans]
MSDRLIFDANLLRERALQYGAFAMFYVQNVRWPVTAITCEL